MTDDTLLDRVSPSHYRSHPSGVECIEISKHLSGCLAQSFQYLWRCGQKDDPVQELEKAMWFIEVELTVDNKHYLLPSMVNSKLNDVLAAEPDAQKAEAFKHIVLANQHDNGIRQIHLAKAISIIVDMVLIETGGIM